MLRPRASWYVSCLTLYQLDNDRGRDGNILVMDTNTLKLSAKVQAKKIQKVKEQDESFKHGELRRIVLSALGVSVLLGGTFLVTPNFPIVFASILSLIKEITRKNIPVAKVKRVLKNLEKKEIIFLEEANGEIKVRIKGIFSPLFLKYFLKPLLIANP